MNNVNFWVDPNGSESPNSTSLSWGQKEPDAFTLQGAPGFPQGGPTTLLLPDSVLESGTK